MFKDKRFDPSNPAANTAVGQGYHQFVWSTFVSKRFRWFDPYFGAWYNLPVRTNGSPFQKYVRPQTSVNPQQRAGVIIGVEQIAWENPRGHQRVTIEARVLVEQHFYGRGRSEIWEPLAGSSHARRTCSRLPPGHRRATPAARMPNAPHPGITEIDSYGTIGGDLGLNVQVGKYIRFRSLFGFRATCPTSSPPTAPARIERRPRRIERPSRPDGPERGEPDLSQAINLPGARFRVEGTKIWTLFIQGSMMF